jgi:DNA-binding transcriptional ArsR family regulator
MDPRCTVCNHASLTAIDQALMDGFPLCDLAAQYGLSSSALSRHLKHLRQALTARDDREHQAHQAALLDELDLLKVRLGRLYRKSEDLHSLHISLGCIQESIRLLALQEKIRHSLIARR